MTDAQPQGTESPNIEHQRTLADTPFPGDTGQAEAGIGDLLAAAGTDSDSYLRAIAALCAVRLLVPVVATATVRGDIEGRLESDRLESDRLESDRLESDRLESDRLESDRLESDRLESDRLESDREAEMAVVLLQTADGRKAMVAFTDLDTLTGWNRQARPVPVTLDVAAGSALQDGAEALLINVAGPHSLAIDGPILAELAAGHRLVELPGGEFGWAQQAGFAAD